MAWLLCALVLCLVLVFVAREVTAGLERGVRRWVWIGVVVVCALWLLGGLRSFLRL